MSEQTKRTMGALSILPEGPEADFYRAMSLIGACEPWNYPTLKAMWEAMKSRGRDSVTSDLNQGDQVSQ